MLERMEKSGVHNETLEQAVIEAANTAESKRRQADAVGRKIAPDAAKNQDKAAKLEAQAVSTAVKKPRKSNVSLRHGVMSPAAWRNMFLTAKYWTWFSKVMYSNACRSIWADFVKYLLRERATAMPMVGVRNTLWNLAET